MRFSTSAAYILFALAIASPFLSEPAMAKQLKGRQRPAYAATKQKAKNTERASSKPNRRKLSGKGKGGGGPDDDFYRFPCEFCGEGNDSALGGEICFSKDMNVQVMGRGSVAMEELQVGDRVLTQDGIFQTVYAFAHRVPDQEATFLQMHSGKGEPLELTHDHLVYLANKENPVRAKSVKVGDVLRSSSDEKMPIRKIETVKKSGIYAPLTLGGSIVVNDFLASSYISLQDADANKLSLSSEYMVFQGSKIQIPIMSHQQYVDMAVAPYRMACRMAGNALCDTTKDISDGMPLYIKLGIAFNRWSSPKFNAHGWAMLATFVFCSPFYLLERAMFLRDGAISWVFLAAVCLTAAGWTLLKRNRVSFVARKVKAA